jgi:zinc transporter
MNETTHQAGNAYLLGPAARALVWEEVPDWKPDQGVLWVHLDYSQAEAADWIRRESGMSPIEAGAILAEETRPRSLVLEQGLLVILRGVNLNPGADPEDMVSVRIWMDDRRIITTGQRKLLSIDDLRDRIVRGRGPSNPGEFLVHLGELLTERIGDVVEDVEDIVDSLEEEVVSGNYQELRFALSSVRRQAVALRRYLAPQREALGRLFSERSVLLDEPVRMRIRELTDRMTRFIEDLDAARDRASVTQEELQNRLAELTNRRMYLLTMIAAIFLPLSFLTGLLGINVGGIPGADYSAAFMIVVVLMLLIGAGQWLFFRWRKWF